MKMNRLPLWAMLSKFCSRAERFQGGGEPSSELRDKNLGHHTCKYLGNIKNSTHHLLISCLREEKVLNQEIEIVVESWWCGHLRLLWCQKWETSLERHNPLSLAGPVTELVLFFQSLTIVVLFHLRASICFLRKRLDFFPLAFFPTTANCKQVNQSVNLFHLSI